MMKGRRLMQLSLLALSAVLQAGENPGRDPFVIRKAAAPGPQITSYLEYQVDLAWQQDEARLSELAAVRSEADLLKLQARLRSSLLDSIGGLPQEKTPPSRRRLHPLTGRALRGLGGIVVSCGERPRYGDVSPSTEVRYHDQTSLDQKCAVTAHDCFYPASPGKAGGSHLSASFCSRTQREVD